jgi:radical SAM superfamily enzyme YgiQ (UPF0313 family)
MKKILFVNPSNKDDILEGIKVLSLPPMNLGLLASYTPEKYDIRIVDETIEDINFEVDADLVAITCMTPLAPRAYEISSRFREMGSKVVLGGVHPSMMPEEAARFADAVVVGEGEGIWPVILKDFEKGKLRPLYNASRPSLERLTNPRRDLFNEGYFVQTVQSSRGCPFNCNFCSVTRFNGGEYRLRPVDDVLSEIGQLNGKRFFFIDDNIIGSGQKYIQRSIQMFEGLKDLRKEWGSQTCIHIAEDDKLLKAAAKSHAKFFFIGFESVEHETLSMMNKHINLRPGIRNFKDAIRRIQDHGIAVIGGFIFGNDSDTEDIFEKTIEFVQDTKIDGAQFSIQTPFPGTRLWEQLNRENRVLLKDYPGDWKRYHGFEVVFQPKNMTVRKLAEGHAFAYRTVASFKGSLFRAIKTFSNTKSFLSTAVSFYWNHEFCKKILSRGQGTTPHI